MNPTTTTNGQSVLVEGKCNNCETQTESFLLLHHVRLRGLHRRLCTSCVLRLHPSWFCPKCFSFYDTCPPSKRYTCSKCNSFTHSHCLPSPTPTTPTTPYLCPPCLDPNFVFFRVGENRVIDKNMAAVWLCAARISAASMAKAAAVARNEAERKVKEAAVSRKKAREALEIVVEKVRRREFEEREHRVTSAAAAAALVEVSGNANANANANVSSFKVEKKEPSNGVVGASDGSVGCGGGGGGGGKVVESTMQQQPTPVQQPPSQPHPPALVQHPVLVRQQAQEVKKVEDDLLEGFDSWNSRDGKISDLSTKKDGANDSTAPKQNAS